MLGHILEDEVFRSEQLGKRIWSIARLNCLNSFHQDALSWLGYFQNSSKKVVSRGNRTTSVTEQALVLIGIGTALGGDM